eukprot:TRINITY_DN1228_c0_g1_i15.p1 TRINITY_DN1228_c0_g1~~TRINITY_DN1228_c0_g1_i15.p1  ORF type:complete len:321 (+),score=54.42 TRINITY_DN1228_c0_g1_i15:81-1043(+)
MKSSLLATNTPNHKLVFTGLVYVSTEEQMLLRCATKYILCEVIRSGINTVDGFVYSFETHPEVKRGTIGLNSFQRNNLNASLNQPVNYTSWRPSENDILHSITLSVKFQRENKGKTDRTYNHSEFEENFRRNFMNLCFTEGQDWALDVAGTTMILSVTQIKNNIVSETRSFSRPVRGLFIESSSVTFVKANESSVKIIGGGVGATSTCSILFGPNFNFEQMGIGGLDQEFGDLFRRAFASRVFPPEVVASMGVHPVKGILLYGPPGTGKTLIARKIGEMLNARPPKIVNGPSILNKFVGQSEENIRNLFAMPSQNKEKKD